MREAQSLDAFIARTHVRVHTHVHAHTHMGTSYGGNFLFLELAAKSETKQTKLQT